MPVLIPVKCELVANLETAKAMGLTFSESFLLRADQVIDALCASCSSRETN